MKEISVVELQEVGGGEPISLGVAAVIILGGVATGAFIAWLAS